MMGAQLMHESWKPEPRNSWQVETVLEWLSEA